MLASCSLCWLAACAAGRASVTVSTLDPAYRDLERLVAYGLVASPSVGQKPYTRAQFARLVREASTADSIPSAVAATLARLQRRFGEHRVERSIELEANQARDAARLIPNRVFGNVDAVISPLLAYREGRPTRDGSSTALEATYETRIAPSVALVVHPRMELAGAPHRATQGRVDIQEAYLAVTRGNLALQLGRASMVWGQGRHAGLLLSQNARGFDMVKLSNDRPFTLPWLFRVLGPSDGTFFFATMAADANRHFPNSYMLGHKLSLHPTPWLEIGGGYMLEAGGRGAPAASLAQRVLDHFFLTTIPYKELGGNQLSNKLSNLELRATFRRAAGLQLYAEWASEDMSRSDLEKWLTQDSGWLLGAYAPRLGPEGRFNLSLEYHVSGIRLYRHHQFLTGLAVDERLMGDALGPEGRAGYAELGWDASPAHSIVLQLAYEGRSYDDYVELPNDRRRKVMDQPQEHRYRATAVWTWRPEHRPFEVYGTVGYERVSTFAFTPGQTRDNFIVQGRAAWRF